MTSFLRLGQKYKKYFRSFFGSNENFKICFRDLLTFRVEEAPELPCHSCLFFKIDLKVNGFTSKFKLITSTYKIKTTMNLLFPFAITLVWDTKMSCQDLNIYVVKKSGLIRNRLGTRVLITYQCSDKILCYDELVHEYHNHTTFMNQFMVTQNFITALTGDKYFSNE